jgi:hypothetical protein
MKQIELETPTSSNQPLALRSKEEVQLHARERMKQFDEGRRTAAAERRAGRLRGELSQSLSEKLESCNPLQLRTVVRLAHKYQELHRKPPSMAECRMKYTEDVLKHVDVRKQRFTLEFRRSSQRGDRVYVNGPYVVSHWRDGSITRRKYFGNKNLRNRIPRKVWDGFRELLASPETKLRLEHLNERWVSRSEE